MQVRVTDTVTGGEDLAEFLTTYDAECWKPLPVVIRSTSSNIVSNSVVESNKNLEWRFW